MIDVHYWTTPNGHKVTIFLEEAGLEYKVIPVNIGKGEQFKADFLAVSPNNRIPAIVDHDPPGGGKPLSGLQVGRDPGLSRREDRQVHSERHSRSRRRAGMAVLADGRSRPDVGTEQSLQQLRHRQDPICDGPLSQRSEPALRRDEQAARRSRISRRRLFDRRHGLLSLGGAVGAAGPEDRRLPASQALVRCHRQAAGGGEGLRMDAEDQSGPRRHPHRRRARDPVWSDRAIGDGGAPRRRNRPTAKNFRAQRSFSCCVAPGKSKTRQKSLSPAGRSHACRPARGCRDRSRRH